MERRFGVELEIVGIGRALAVAAIRRAGIEVYDAGYTHDTSRQWKVVTDNSVRDGSVYGFEVVSPILFGLNGLEQVKTVASALRAAGGKVNKTCGLHVHIDAHDFSAKQMRNFLVNYAKFEGVIDSFLAPSRRGNLNVYTKSNMLALGRVYGFPDGAIKALRKLDTVDQVIRLMHRDCGEAGREDRFFKLNLTSYYRHKTVEFRHHQGSVDPVKIVNWIKLLERFVNASVNAKPRWWKSVRVTENEKLQRFFEQMNAEDLRRYFQARRRHFLGKPRKWDKEILSGVDPMSINPPSSAEIAEPEAEEAGIITHHRTGRATPEANAQALAPTPDEQADLVGERMLEAMRRNRRERAIIRHEEALGGDPVVRNINDGESDE